MPLYTGDYLADCGHEPDWFHGRYLLLIIHYWQTGKPLPDDDDQLWRIARAPSLEEWQLGQSKIKAYFQVRKGHWYHKRVQNELERAQKVSERGRENVSKRTWRPINKDNDLETTLSNPIDPNAIKPQSEVKDPHNHNHIHKEDKISERVKSPDTSIRGARGSRLPDDWTMPEEWKSWARNEFVEMEIDEDMAAEWVDREALKFHDYWASRPGKEGLKLNWFATWRNRVRDQIDRGYLPGNNGGNGNGRQGAMNGDNGHGEPAPQTEKNKQHLAWHAARQAWIDGGRRGTMPPITDFVPNWVQPTKPLN